jgi:hypothetical protein
MPSAILQDPDIQKALESTISYYYNDCKQIIVAAEVAGGGERPVGLPNEVYSCFHHIARAICEPTCKNPAAECGDKAVNHLKRAAYDAHKIVINDSLRQTEKYLDYLSYVLTDQKYRNLIADDYDKICEMRKCRDAVKSLYFTAKMKESAGSDDTLRALEEATEKSQELLDYYNNLSTKNSIAFIAAALAKEEAQIRAEEARVKKKDQWEKTNFVAVWIMSLIAVVVSVISICLKCN